MRKYWVVLLILVFPAVATGQTALASLGIKEADAREQAVRALNGRVPVGLAAAAFRAANGATRGALVQGILAWVKAYAQSPAFKAEYDRQREQNRPPARKLGPSIDEELAKQKAERTK